MNMYAFWTVAIAAVVTVLLRAIPFLLFSGDRKLPKSVEYLGKTLPYAVMGMLVVFCLKGTAFNSLGAWAPQLIAGLLVVISYVWKRSTILSILVGTICYMLLVQLVFV